MIKLALVFGSLIGTLPFMCLGLPMGTLRPMIHDLAHVSDHIEHRLNVYAHFLPHGGSLMLVNSVLSVLPTYMMCSLQHTETFIKNFT